MSLKLKALGLGLLAAMAMSVVAVTNAGAERTGHFTSDSPSGVTTITGEEGTGLHNKVHKIEFGAPNLQGNPIGCGHASFDGTINVATTQEIHIVPTYRECRTTDDNGVLTGAVVHVNFRSCTYKFTSRSVGHATAGLVCATPGDKVELHDTGSGCRLKFGPQTIANAVTYNTDTATQQVGLTHHVKHAITLESTATGIKFTAHNGLCVFIATNQVNGALEGSATVWGEDPKNNNTLVNITAT